MNRLDIKDEASESLRNNRMRFVGASLLMSIAAGRAAAFLTTCWSASLNGMQTSIGPIAPSPADPSVSKILPAVLSMLAVFILNPLCVAVHQWYLRKNMRMASCLKYAFGRTWMRNVIALAIKGFLISLGLIMFIVPGILAILNYWFVPYLLAAHPNMKAMEALKMSKKMAKGRKKDLMLFELSFIGWRILSTITFGLVGIFHADPYMDLARTLYFEYAAEPSPQDPDEQEEMLLFSQS